MKFFKKKESVEEKIVKELSSGVEDAAKPYFTNVGIKSTPITSEHIQKVLDSWKEKYQGMAISDHSTITAKPKGNWSKDGMYLKDPVTGNLVKILDTMTYSYEPTTVTHYKPMPTQPKKYTCRSKGKTKSNPQNTTQQPISNTTSMDSLTYWTIGDTYYSSTQWF